MAALVLFFVVVMGSSIGWEIRDRSAREAEASQRQAARQAKVAGQVESILTEVDQLVRKQKWPDALAAARRAESAAASGEADEETVELVRQSLNDLAFIGRLEQIRMERATIVGGNFNNTGADRDYALAFREYGVDIEALAVEASIDRLKARPAFAIPLAAALDEWVDARGSFSERDAAIWKRLVAVARGIDPEPLRDRLRSTWGKPVAEVQDELRRLAESIDVRAQHPATLCTLAQTLNRANQSASARPLLRNAQFVYPGDFWLNYDLGSALSNQKNYEGAIRFYTAAVSIRPHAAAAHNNLGVALRDQGNVDEAIACYHTAIEIDPKNANAYNNLGIALGDQKKLDEAIAAHRKAIEFDPKNANAHYNLGIALVDQNKLYEAIAAFRNAIELDPNHANAHASLGIALHHQGKLDEAIAACRKAIEIDPTLAGAHNNLGAFLCDGLRDYVKAIECFRKAIELDPKHANAYNGLGNALRHQGKVDEAIVAYRKAIEIDPKNANAYSDLATALNDEKKWDEAVAAYNKALAIDPQHANAHNGLAWLLATCPDVKLRDPSRAFALARKAIDLNPKNWAYHNTLGTASYRAGEWKGAIAALEKSMELRQGGDSSDWFFLAMAHWQLGEQDKAREWYDRAVQWMDKNQPTDEELRRFRAEAEELMKKH